MIMSRNINWEAVLMDWSTVTTLGLLLGLGQLGLSSESDVVVNELTPGNKEDGDSMVMEAFILNT